VTEFPHHFYADYNFKTLPTLECSCTHATACWPTISLTHLCAHHACLQHCHVTFTICCHSCQHYHLLPALLSLPYQPTDAIPLLPALLPNLGLPCHHCQSNHYGQAIYSHYYQSSLLWSCHLLPWLSVQHTMVCPCHTNLLMPCHYHLPCCQILASPAITASPTIRDMPFTASTTSPVYYSHAIYCHDYKSSILWSYHLLPWLLVGSNTGQPIATLNPFLGGHGGISVSCSSLPHHPPLTPLPHNNVNPYANLGHFNLLNYHMNFLRGWVPLCEIQDPYPSESFSFSDLIFWQTWWDAQQ